MDVKFPLDNYVRHLEADNDLERKPLPRPVPARRARPREGAHDARLPRRDRRDRRLPAPVHPERAGLRVRAGDTTATLLDDAMRHKIVLCSPLTLYAVLAVVRQAVDNFRLERTSNEILALLGEFSRQWEKYSAQLDTGAAALRRRGEGVRGADDDAPPRAAATARQDRAAAARGAGARRRRDRRSRSKPDAAASIS